MGGGADVQVVVIYHVLGSEWQVITPLTIMWKNSYSFRYINILPLHTLHHSNRYHPPFPPPLSRTLLKPRLNRGLERLRVRADDLPNLLLVLEQQEGGHGADAEVLGDVGDFVDVELVEAGGGVGVGHPGGELDVVRR